MKNVSSLKNVKNRHPLNKLVKRKGILFIINKKYPRYKAKQKA